MKTPTKTVTIDLNEDEDTRTGTTIVNEDRPIALPSSNPDVVNEDADPLDKLPDHAVKNDDGSVTLRLFYPKKLTTMKNGQVREREFNELTFHRLAGADQRAIGAASDGMMNIVALARSARLNQAVMNALYDKMDAADINDAGRVLSHFLTNGPKTGR